MIKKSDFESCPYPDGHPVIIALCQFANIVEEAIELIYNRRTDSLRQLYGTAEALYAQVRQYGNNWGLSSASSVQREEAWNAETSVLLHNGRHSNKVCLVRPGSKLTDFKFISMSFSSSSVRF